ncbi:ATP-binding protein [Salinarchaeum sp. IM2453]|uniref:AAA family ATPase n=1 Tax=Salinarchaeum sp. IM2453 TaxID=2862870 RepID=UPI001C838227|nr:ATP-binding protein [Salinarchaeum sp. IM2453]QZA88659.1 ATP-binding protein [Salinarchaeum sp. IM2453]
MSNPELEVIELLLTAEVYDESRALDEDDIPPRYRRVFWSEGTFERPLTVTASIARSATGIDQPWETISGLMFTERDQFSGKISINNRDMAEEWFLSRVDSDRVQSNPTLAYRFEDHEDAPEGIDYETARENNRPIRADRVWIDSLLEEYFDEEEEQDMLDLVEIRAPEEIETTLDDIVLTDNQEAEITKLVKAIEHREYLAEIGLKEVGKLLFIGPPGTGKTSAARGLAHELDLPFVEVKLSMITSQYLGETAKNVDKTFEVAKRLSPCILFIDEFDSVAKTRTSDEHAAVKRAVNTLLKSIDEVSLIDDEVLLIGATNHPDQLDAAAWRRFDEIVNFPKPDVKMREDILRLITHDMEIKDFDPEAVAKKTDGLTGSDLRMVLREAVLEALTEERTALTQSDLMSAIEEFEQRDTLKNLDMIEGDHEALIAGGLPGESDSGHSHNH